MMHELPTNISDVPGNYTYFNISDPFFDPGIVEIDIKELACVQMQTWQLNTGIILLTFYPIVLWVTWWFVNKGYKRFIFSKNMSLAQRYHLQSFIHLRYIIVLVAYISILVYLSW